MDLDGNIFLGGFTDGKWNDSNPGGNDFICVKLNLFDGSEITRWQVRDLSSLIRACRNTYQ